MKSGLVMLLVPLASPAMASVDAQMSVRPENSVMDERVPPLKLDQPNWGPISGQQISSAFAGRVLIVDEEYHPYPKVRVAIYVMGGCAPREHFSANGVWTRFECQRAMRRYTGRWETEKFRGGERLCVAAPDFSKLCRFVWVGAASDRVFMAVNTRFLEKSMDDPTTFNPYRLVVDDK